MSKSRLEAFSDGVMAIIITIMVLELAVPHEADLTALRPLIPKFLSYALSFVFLGIYWNNHHHLFQAIKHVDGRVLWANLHLLFWLSLIPFVTGWMGENQFAGWPVALYGVVLLLAAIAYFILTRTLISLHGRDSILATAVGRDFKGKVSPVIYLAAIALAFVNSWLACALYVLVAVIWLIPDRRIEQTLVQWDVPRETRRMAYRLGEFGPRQLYEEGDYYGAITDRCRPAGDSLSRGSADEAGLTFARRIGGIEAILHATSRSASGSYAGP
jgi:uncharacterized membrane protein